MIELNYQERMHHLNIYVDFLENSVRRMSSIKASKKEISEQKDLLSLWPKLGNEFKNLEKYEAQIPETLKIEFENIQSLPMDRILIKDYQQHEDFSRAQTETVAGRVSAIN